MKFRLDFVTNSSSSSYICDVCGRVESGYDMGISDAEMYQCKNGHTFCEDEALKPVSEKELAIKFLEQDLWKDQSWRGAREESYKEELRKDIAVLRDPNSNSDEVSDLVADIIGNYDIRYSMPAEYCPICQMQEMSESIMVKYLLKLRNKNFKEVVTEMRNNFLDYQSLMKFIGGK
jgi:hypothetical protein